MIAPLAVAVLVAAVLPVPASADGAFGGPPPEIRSGLARFNAVSKDGRRVIFSSRRRFARGDRDRTLDVYLRTAGRTVLLSRGGGAGEAGERVDFEAATPDARTVIFRTEDRLSAEDDDSSWDLYRRGPSGLELASPGPRGEETSDRPRSGALSADGSRAFFATSERLAAEDEDDRQDVYEYRRGRISLVTVGVASHARLLAVSADGSRVVFATSAAVVVTDQDGREDIYERSAGATTLVSGGGPGSCPTDPGVHPHCPVEFRAASRDGSRVFFEAWERLAPGDSDSSIDVYMHGPGGLQLISTGPSDSQSSDARLATITPDGRRAFFASGETFGRLARGTHGALFERRAGRTSLVSIGKRGPIAVDSGESSSFFVSRDGDRIVFAGGQSGHEDGGMEIFMRSGGGVARRLSGNPPPPFEQFGAFLRHGSSTGAGRAVFVTARRLDRRDRDNAYDIYAYGPRGTRVVSVGPQGGNASPSDPIGGLIFDVPTFGGATDDGRFVFFTSEERLIRRDRDDDIDLYRRGPSGLSLVSTR